jgi:hypothetical protein
MKESTANAPTPVPSGHLSGVGGPWQRPVAPRRQRHLPAHWQPMLSVEAE